MLGSVLHISEGTWGRAMVYKEKSENEKNPKKLIENSIPRFQISMNRFQEKDSDSEKEVLSEESGSITFDILPNFHASMFGTILEDTATQLHVLVESSNEIKIIKTKTDWAFLMRKKFGVKEKDSLDELEGIDLNNLDCTEYKIEKLDMDRIHVINVIKSTYMDLCLKKSFKTLEDSVNAILAVTKYRIALAEEEAKNRALRRELIRQLRQLRNHIKSVIYDTDVKIDELSSQVEDAVLISECRGRHIDGWQRARTEQHAYTILDTETGYTKSIENYKQKSDQENRVHVEVEMIINISLNETLQKVEDMMTKYDIDMESIDLKIQIQKNDYQNMMDKRQALQNIIDNHEKEMSDWVYFKDERERARLYRVKMNDAASAVQAWWRGLLVRFQLGPFKPSKRRGAAAADAAKGKKKK